MPNNSAGQAFPRSARSHVHSTSSESARRKSQRTRVPSSAGYLVVALTISLILFFGYALDALVTTGVIGNLIVFLLIKITRLRPLRIAFWTFLVINAVPALLLAFVGGRLSPNFKVGATLLGYVISFLFWLGVHYVWAQFKNDKSLAVSSAQ